MAGGIHLSALIDLFLGTSQAVLTGENFIRNERQPRNTLLWEILKGHDMEEMLQGGDVITDQVILAGDQTYGPYSLLEPKSPRHSNHLTEISINWAFTDASVTFLKHEKGLNMASMLNRGARVMVFKKIIKAKWSNLFVETNRGMEKEFFATPNNDTMEAATPTTGKRVPLSLFVTIHEFGALVADANPVATVPPGFTTVQGVNPTTFPLWTNPVEFYATPPPTTDARWLGFEKFMRLKDRLKFESMAIRPEYGQQSEAEGFFMTSAKGKSMYTFATANANDFLRHGPSNPAYPGINFEGIPVMWKESMDTANVWKDTAGTGFAGENNNTLDSDGAATGDPEWEGPRFVLVVPKFYKKIMHSEHFMEQETPPASVEQPYQRTIYFDCWHNNWNDSRQRAGGVITPSADITGYI